MKQTAVQIVAMAEKGNERILPYVIRQAREFCAARVSEFRRKFPGRRIARKTTSSCFNY